jgi:hypothetical protein
MSWDLKHTVLAGTAAVTFIGGGVALSAWVKAHDSWVRAEATVQAQAVTIRDITNEELQAASQEKERDAKTARQVADMQAALEKVRTARQVAEWLPKQVPLPKAIKITVPRPSRTNAKPDAVATIPRPDLLPLRDYVESCKVCSVKLATAQQDLATKQQELTLAGEKLAAVEKQRDAALKAERGSFWGRLLTRAKWLIVGAGAGAAFLCGSGHCQ